eukprot:1139692-Pelagomonas_calceolata.AAC.3
MERLSLNKAAPNDKAAKSRLSLLDLELSQLKKDQTEITEKWQAEKREMSRVQVCPWLRCIVSVKVSMHGHAYSD